VEGTVDLRRFARLNTPHDGGSGAGAARRPRLFPAPPNTVRFRPGREITGLTKSNHEGRQMKHVIVSCLVACAIMSAAALGPAGVTAAVRHIPVNHSPAPPLSTVEISSGNPTPTIVSPAPPANAACGGCPQNGQASCVGCPPQSQTVQINIVQIPL
jgi:hypothetical protein